MAKNPGDHSKVDIGVQVIVVSERKNLRKTFFLGRVWLGEVFRLVKEDGAEAGVPLTAIQIKQLLPKIVKDGKLSLLILTIVKDGKLPLWSTVFGTSFLQGF